MPVHRRHLFPLVFLIAAASACNADQPALTDAHLALDAHCSGPHADQVLDVFPTTLPMPTAALGDPDGATVTLAPNDVLTVGFIGLGAITDASGVDLRIHATIAAGGAALVRVAGTDQVFQYIGTLAPNQDSFDLGVAMITSAVYVRVIDTQGTIAIDSFEAVHDHCP